MDEESSTGENMSSDHICCCHCFWLVEWSVVLSHDAYHLFLAFFVAMLLLLTFPVMSEAQDSPESDKLLWPVASALTARLRRLITVYQRCNRKELSRPEILAPTNHNYWLQDEMVRRVEMDPIMKEMQKRYGFVFFYLSETSAY